MVCHIDKNSVSLSNINSRPWEPPINSYYGFCMAQPAHILHLNLIKCNNKKKKVTLSSIEKLAKCYFVRVNECSNSHQIGTSLWQLQLEKKLSQEIQGKEK